MIYYVVDTFSYWLKQALDSALTHGDISTFNFYTYKAIDPATGQPPQLELPYVAIDIPTGGPLSYRRKKANILCQPVIERTRIVVQIGGRMQVEYKGMMTGGFDTDVLPLVTVIEDFVERNPCLSAPSQLAAFAGNQIGVIFDDPPGQKFRVKDHEGHLFFVLLEHMTKTKEA